MDVLKKLNKCFEVYFDAFSNYNACNHHSTAILINAFCSMTATMKEAAISPFKSGNLGYFYLEDSIKSLPATAWYMACFDAIANRNLQDFNLMAVMMQRANQEMLEHEVYSRMANISDFSQRVLEFAKYIEKDPEYSDICSVYHILDAPEMRMYIRQIGDGAEERGDHTTSKFQKFYSDAAQRQEILGAYLYKWNPDDIRILSNMF